MYRHPDCCRSSWLEYCWPATSADGDSMTDDSSKTGTGTTVGDTPMDGPPAVDSVPSTPLPALIDLTLDVQPVFDDDVLVDFIRSRWRPTEATSEPQLSLSQSSNASGSSSLGISDVETTDPPKPLPIACLSRFSLTRATGLLFDELRTRLEVIGKEGLEVIFSG
ncbi:hypothetical protein BDP27DRAFT_941624 [Rhodocollybia butyracea]|uniref:Uncharacterized protein n=1 Tax=Rhodocollybia butyracea TaxID=206335 RepID=A0A9P5PSA5_9AGAR|nr:hypothetical protein BDP27DRAFT_941624 [Rhodocollybia butyracea]